MAVEFHRLAFLAYETHLRHTDYLKTFAGCGDAEILRALEYPFAGVLHFEFCTAMGAGATCEGVT